VTVPVARASARRTVRVAAGLVAGQVVLGAVIGYVTLGGHGSGGTSAGRMVDPLAAHPFVVLAPAVPPPSRSPTSTVPEPPVAARATTPRQPAEARSRRRPELMPTPTAPAEPPPDVLVATSEPATVSAPVPPSTVSPDVTSTSATETAAPSPPVSASTQLSVRAGDPCDPVDAPGVTTDGKAALCVSQSDHVSRWQTIN
jgi:hypothetical protein